jgi:hypothetical protein
VPVPGIKWKHCGWSWWIGIITSRFTLLFFLIFTRQVDDWDEIFKGPHWNLLANGEWATANFKPCSAISPNYHDYIIPCSLREYMPANDKLTELKSRKDNSIYFWTFNPCLENS